MKILTFYKKLIIFLDQYKKILYLLMKMKLKQERNQE